MKREIDNIGLATGIITRAVQCTKPMRKLPLTLLQLQAELIQEDITKGVYREALYQVIQGTLCEQNLKARKILKNTEAWWWTGDL